jgi:NAD(P)-dependent dehydrogenase (short-subunit alcohol dehydrogenase family)
MTDTPPLVAVVTGGARGIGLGISQRLADAGYRVAIWDRDSEGAGAAAADLRQRGATAIGIACDVSSYEQVSAAAFAVRQELGTPLLLVNNAATRHRARLEDLSRADWDDEVAINLTGVFQCTQVLGRLMLAEERGNIVNIASLSAQSGHVLRGAYTPTKAGVLGLTMLTAVEWGPRGIRCNAISPGIIVSPGNRDVYADTELTEGRRAFVPLGRLGSADDIGDAVVFLASDAARFINGVNLAVDGGTSQSLVALIPTIGPDGTHLRSATQGLIRGKPES